MGGSPENAICFAGAPILLHAVPACDDAIMAPCTKVPFTLIGRLVRDAAKRQNLIIQKSPSLARNKARRCVWQQVLLFGVMMPISA